MEGTDDVKDFQETVQGRQNVFVFFLENRDVFSSSKDTISSRSHVGDWTEPTRTVRHFARSGRHSSSEQRDVRRQSQLCCRPR